MDFCCTAKREMAKYYFDILFIQFLYLNLGSCTNFLVLFA